MDINKISIEELKKDPKKYARECTTDELLDALNLSKENNERKQAIIDILTKQQEIKKEWNNNEEANKEFNLNTLLEKFHSNIDWYSLKNRLIEIWAENPELSFKLGLLKYSTLLLEGEEISEDENDIFEEFNIDTTDIVLLNKLKSELELDLQCLYSIKSNNYIDISTNNWVQESLNNFHETAKRISELKNRDGRLDGKKILVWHCAYNDSPSGLKLFGEDVVEYNLWDDYIPRNNHANSLELLNKVEKASIEELENMYLEIYDNDLEYYKEFNKNNKKRYVLSLKEEVLREFIDLLSMYESGYRFIVVKATYKDKEISDRKYINCWYVDIYSDKTKKTYRVLSH